MDSSWVVSHPLIIGHRGASADAPENTLPAFTLAQTQGADGIEFDVQLAKDGVPVIIHDPTLERTTNGIGHVHDFTAAQLAQLDAGNDAPIPTLNQLFETCGKDFLYNVEIKGEGWFDRGLERTIAQIINRHQLENQVVVSSFHPAALWRARRALPSRALTAALLYKPFAAKRLPPAWFGAQAEHPGRKMVDKAYMDWARQHQLRVHVWTVDEPAEAKRLLNLGAHGIITNKPGYMRRQLNLL